jgi:hypothetical protein
VLTCSARWHILTAIGGYTSVALVDEITSGEVTSNPAPRLAWPVPFAAKYILGISPTEKANAANAANAANGVNGVNGKKP